MRDPCGRTGDGNGDNVLVLFVLSSALKRQIKHIGLLYLQIIQDRLERVYVVYDDVLVARNRLVVGTF